MEHDASVETLQRIMQHYKTMSRSGQHGATRSAEQGVAAPAGANVPVSGHPPLRPLKRANAPMPVGGGTINSPGVPSAPERSTGPKVLPLKRKAETQGLRRIPLGKKGK